MPSDPPLGTGSGPRDNATTVSAVDAVVTGTDEEEAGFVDRRVDLAISAAAAALGLFLIYESYGIRRGSIPDPIGSGGWARVLGIALAIAGSVLIFRRLAAWRGATSNLVPSDGGKDAEAGYASSGLRPFVLVAAGFGWILTVRHVGFLIPTFVLSVACTALMKVRSPLKLVLVPLIFTFAIWGLFGQVFGIRFPVGPLEQFLQEILPRL